jgi:hypothetical protein
MGTEDDYGLGALDPPKPSAERTSRRRDTQPPAAKSLPFFLYDDLDLAAARKDWLVEGLLGVGEASSFYGEPGCGKSVLVEDLGLHIAAGKPWHGRAVKQGAVLYLALERAQLVKRRAIAFRLHTDLTGLPFAIFGGELDFRDIRTADAVAKMFEQLAFATRADPVLITLDTVSRALCGGDENSPKDMGAVVRTIGRVQQLTGAHILSTHHTPAAGGDRLRGFGGLKGGLDTTIYVEKKTSIRTATVIKANDSEEGETIAFDLESIEIDRDENGGVTTAPIVVSADAPKGRAAPPRRLNDRQKLALEALSNCAIDKGNPPPDTLGLPAGVTVVNVHDWRDYLLDSGILDREAPNPRTDFQRLKDQLQARHLIAERGSLVWRI